MLTSIEIAGEATYPVKGEKLTDLKKINYLFGHNGCGKTTVSRVIHDPASRAGYTVTWKDGRAISTLVYNRDFADTNFGDQLKGIFTLGEDSTKVVEDIGSLQNEISKLDREIDGLRRNLEGEDGEGGRRAELKAARVLLDDACWKSQQSHKATFEEAMTGHRQSKVAFCNKILKEAGQNKSDLLSIEDLTARAATVFQWATTQEPSIAPITFGALDVVEKSTILSRKVVGRDDVVVAALIGKLGNSDWVKQGVDYLKAANGPCPFCQQKTPATLMEDLNSFFDEQYETDLAEIGELISRYETVTKGVYDRIDALLASPSRFLDAEALTERYHALRTAFELNQDRLASKRREPSTAVTLEGTKGFADAIATLLAQANEAINQHNEAIRDLSTSKRTLTAQVWRFIIEERRTDLATYETSATALNKAIEGLEGKISEKRTTRAELAAQLKAKEACITSVKPTVDEINRILSSFGFTSFKLAVAGERNDMYRIVRLDGSDAAKTLSEGERSFITFLYFYHMLAGSTSGTGTTVEKVVVFDDPVSSLDADVLFIVSALIRGVIADVRAGRGSVRQIFVLTHNIYFHKEVSYDRNRPASGCLRDESFWIIRKRDNISSLHHYTFNPVKTSYELLWEDVRNPERANLTIQNTLRRIVENYLIVLGGWHQDSIVALFEGRDSQICASLFSWINDGSHSAHDDIYLAADDNAVQGYLRVFAEVFEKTGHVAHYKMMMHISDDEDENSEEGEPPAPVAPAAGPGALA
ncbi:AAA family ATPase [Xanthobacter aminoxidans]|uniref:AAA family ATPase n=1 Tax=Xanthobacter aminoxidans TaxID=186280 RepID=UPI002022D936|nr:AAA family ATPase [Xanthobacter aminoxidans]